MNRKEGEQKSTTQTSTQNKSANGMNKQLIRERESSKTTDVSKNTKRNSYIQSFAGLVCLAFLSCLFFYTANTEKWHKMTSSCGHTGWIGFFLVGIPLFAGAVAFEASALSHRRNLLSVCFLIIITLSFIAMLFSYSNMNSTLSGC